MDVALVQISKFLPLFNPCEPPSAVRHTLESSVHHSYDRSVYTSTNFGRHVGLTKMSKQISEAKCILDFMHFGYIFMLHTPRRFIGFILAVFFLFFF